MTDILRSPLTIQAFAEAFRRLPLPPGRFPDVVASDRREVVFPSQQLGKSYRARWDDPITPFAQAAMESLTAPRQLLSLKDRMARAEMRRKIFGDPYTDEEITIVKSSSVGTTEVAMAHALKTLAQIDRFRAAERWRRRAPDVSWLMTPNGYPVEAWEEVWRGDQLEAVWVGADYAADRLEWDVLGRGRERWNPCNLPQPIDLKPPPRRTKRELLSTSANVDLNKVESVRSTKPANQAIRELVVRNCAPSRNVVRKRGHGHA